MKKEFPKWIPWLLLVALLCMGAGVHYIADRLRIGGLPGSGDVLAVDADGNVFKTNVVASGGGTNYPTPIRIGTNITVGSGVRQSLTIQTNASFAIVFTGTPINGEHISLAVSNSATSIIYLTNTAGIFDPPVASNVTTFAIAATSIRFFEFVSSTNFALGVARWEVRDMLGKEVELAAGNQVNLTTNAPVSIISVNVNSNLTVTSLTTDGNTNGTFNLQDTNSVTLASVTADGGGQITVRLAHIPTNDAPFTRLSSPLVSGQFWTNTTGARCLLAVNYTLTASAISGSPSLCMTNITSGEAFNASNSLALAVITTGRAAFFVGTNEYFVLTNQSSGNAAATVDATVATRH